ncbi:MAG: sigma-70 family RNA polymerase sigma factor [Alistipes sp.]|nr:sigma-70 family RNA polymerase sigma factor [Alistipes sp.]
MKVTEGRYTEFILSVKDTIFRLAKSIVGSSAEAEDITQDIYEKVWRARDKVLSERYPRAYVCRMTRNLSIDHLRSRVQVVEVRDSDSTDGRVTADVNDMAQFTKRIIASLPERQRTIIEMRDVEGYQIDEIADMLECDAVSVRMNLSRARKRVREELLKAIDYER